MHRLPAYPFLVWLASLTPIPQFGLLLALQIGLSVATVVKAYALALRVSSSHGLAVFVGSLVGIDVWLLRPDDSGLEATPQYRLVEQDYAGSRT